MKALRVPDFEGTPWRLEDAPTPQPAPDEVQVRVAATAISFVDLLFARGGYQVRPPLPTIPGTEFAGVVTACGASVGPRLAIGQPVTGTVFGGAWAEFACALATDVAPLPANADLHTASTLPITGATAVYALQQRGHLQPGETVLVLGATGGVGLAAVQVARALGATVIAGARGDRKRAMLTEAGAHHVVDTGAADWRAAVQAVAPQGIDVVVDPVGGPLTDTAFRTLRWGGRHLVVGFAEGAIPSLRSNLPLLKGASLVGVDIRQYREREALRAQANLDATVALFAQGALRPRVAQVLPVKDWAAAIAAAEDRGTAGRVVMDWR
jgi:NADPH2:quinone reductase